MKVECRPSEKSTNKRRKQANTFQALHEQSKEEPDLNSLRQNIKEMLTSNFHQVVGLKNTQQKDWVTAETWCRIHLRKEKLAINNSRTRATKVQEYQTKG